MKNLFPGYFIESEEKLKQLWDSCIFVFDANIILNLYRYSDATKKEFSQFLKKIENRVWLPHRAAEEYLNRRLSVIAQQERSYDDTVKSISSLRSNLKNARQHPFVSQETLNETEKVFKLLCNELSENKQIHSARITNDEIQESISMIFENKVGQPYSEENLKKIITDGEERYKQKIPPGFKDEAKSGDSVVFIEICKKYGDLIIWNQILDKSIESKKGIILVTDDKKEDWWENFNGKTIGPRPELVKEFKDRTNKNFHMYQADRFLEFARKFLNEEISNNIVKEIRAVRRQDKLDYNNSKEERYIFKRKFSIHHLDNEIDIIQKELDLQRKEINMMEEEKHILVVKIKNSRDQFNQLSNEDKNGKAGKQISEYIRSLNNEIDQLNKRSDHHMLLIDERDIHLSHLKDEINFFEQNRSKYFKRERELMDLEDEIDHHIILSQENKESNL